MAWAVSATTTTPAIRASERILRVIASPSSPGSWMSIRTMSGSSRVISARHSAPLPALRTLKPFFSRRNWVNRRLTGLSSTINTLPPVAMDQEDTDPSAPAVEPLANAAQLVLHRRRGPRLGDVARDAELVHQRLIAGYRADQHGDVRGGGPGTQLLEDLPAVFHRKDGLHHEQVGQNLHRLAHRLLAIEGVRDPKSDTLDLRRHPLATGGGLFHHHRLPYVPAFAPPP